MSTPESNPQEEREPPTPRELRKIRTGHHVSQKQLAEKLPYTKTHLSMIERGSVAPLEDPRSFEEMYMGALTEIGNERNLEIKSTQEQQN